MITKEDILKVAKDLNFAVPSQDAISNILENFDSYAKDDPTSTWDIIIENMLYNLETPKRITGMDVLNWHGSDHTIEELADVLAEILNGEYELSLAKEEIGNH